MIDTVVKALIVINVILIITIWVLWVQFFLHRAPECVMLIGGLPYPC